MDSVHFRYTYTDNPAFWQVAEDRQRGIQVIRLHPQAKMAELEDRVRAEFNCEFHWPRPDPGSESEHRGDCWLVFPGTDDATRALSALSGWKFVTWHIKVKRAQREKPLSLACWPSSPIFSLNSPPLSPLPSPLSPLSPLQSLPEPAMAIAPALPVAFVNTTTGDVTIMTQITQGRDGHQKPTSIKTSPTTISYLIDWQKWGMTEPR